MTDRKPTSEIVAELRAMYGTVPARAVRTAAERLAELEAELESAHEALMVQAKIGADLAAVALDALRLPCPTCGGDWANGVKVEGGESTPCPDCSDGLMSHERAWRIIAVLFGGLHPRIAGEQDAPIAQGWSECVHYLWSIR